ncbi:hypothetical protein F2Q69_00019561 [Brassica cretica]|uniref:RNase H type-1 domain-containing protein n=1 Tax=Brassica cretica TaxID=69181 RepID=A0A8S9QBA3_BRACR|nr:hypothetical protein F2Q69_00019561 [Brassica cretica]
MLFDNRPSSPQELLRKAIFACKEWENAQSHPLKAPIPKQISPPQPPMDPNIVICYTDAAWRSDRKAAGLAWIFTDDTSKEITRCSQFQDAVGSPLMAEALIHASSLNFSQIWLRSDSQGLVTAINANHRPIELFGILLDVASLISSKFSFVSVSFISCLINGHKDLLAKAYLCMH